MEEAALVTLQHGPCDLQRLLDAAVFQPFEEAHELRSARPRRDLGEALDEERFEILIQERLEDRPGHQAQAGLVLRRAEIAAQGHRVFASSIWLGRSGFLALRICVFRPPTLDRRNASWTLGESGFRPARHPADLTPTTGLTSPTSFRRSHCRSASRPPAFRLLKYVNEARPQLVSELDDYTIFLTDAGERRDLEYISHTVHHYVYKAGIGKTGSAHLFRHTMATLMLEGGADIRFIQQMPGRVSLRTTERYTHISIRTPQKVYVATHPGANLQRRK